MMLDLKAVDQRIKSFVSYFNGNTLCCGGRSFLALQSGCQALASDPEEKLFCILLTTHFDSPHLAGDFRQKASWKWLQESDESDIRRICDEYFSRKKLTGDSQIGDHRRHFRCLPTAAEKTDHTVDVLASYKQAIGRYGSQAAFFEVNSGQVEFDVLYRRMKDEIACFQQRLPRFDHLERVSRLHGLYVTPERFYAEEASGPLYGLTWLLFGKRLGKDEGITKRALVELLPAEWNRQMDSEYMIPTGASFEEVIKSLERWLIVYVRSCGSLSSERRNDRAFVFDLESCLCSWQKGRHPHGS